MKLNLEFYNENQPKEVSLQDEKIFEVLNNENLEDVLEKDTSVNTYIHLSKVKENLLNWYEFKNTTSILEIGSNFGELVDFLHNKFKKVTLIEENIHKAKCIEKRFKDLDNIDLIVGNIENINLEEKFDYIVISNFLERHSLENVMPQLKKYLKEDGTLLIAIDNKYGIKKWNGKGGYIGLSGKNKEFGELEIRKIISNNGFKNSKFYYIFPEYKAPNIIYTANHNITLEDITRNFELNEENEINSFTENEVLNEIIKEDKSKIKFFANSFLVEVSNNDISSKVNYVTFTNYRNESCQIQTIIDDKKVVKRAINSKAIAHIKNIINNMKYFPKENVKLLDRVKDEETIESDFVEGIRLDEKIANSQNLEEEFDKYKELIFQNTLKFTDIKKEDLLELFDNYDIELLKELNFIEYAFVDMIPKNCFIVNNENCFFDQEWMLKFVPVEYILYRAIVNTSNIDTERIIKYYNLNKFLNLFNDLEIYFRDTVIDKNILLNIFNRRNENKINIAESYIKKIKEIESVLSHKEDIIAARDLEISQKIEKIEADRRTIEEKQRIIEENIQDIKEHKKHIDELEDVIKDRENQLAIIGNSLSWKVTKPLRYVSEILKKCYRRLSKWLKKS